MSIGVGLLQSKNSKHWITKITLVEPGGILYTHHQYCPGCMEGTPL